MKWVETLILWVNVLVILIATALLFFLFAELSKRSVERYEQTFKPYEKSDGDAIKEAWDDVGNTLKEVMGIEKKNH